MERLETVVRLGPTMGRRFAASDSLEVWNLLRYEEASLLGRWASLGFHSPGLVGDFPSVMVGSAGFHSVGSRSDLPSWNLAGIRPSGMVRGVGWRAGT